MFFWNFLVFASSQASFLYGFKWMNFTFNSSQEAETYETSKTYQYCIPTGLQVDSKGDFFISLPRYNDLIPATLAKLDQENGKNLLSPFPSWWLNSLSNPVGLISISTFEIDLSDNFWLVDEGGRRLYKMSAQGEIEDFFDLSEAMTIESKLVGLALDLDRGFAYISDSGSCGVIIVDLNVKKVRLLFQNHFSTIPDQSFWITINGSRLYDEKSYSVGVSGISLSCDKRDLYWAPVTSRDLFTIGTRHIRNANDTDYLKFIRNLGYKDTASQGILMSEKENLYLTDLLDGNVYFYEQMMPYPDYFLPYFLKQVMNDSDINWPYSLTFNNAKRTLIVLANQFQNFGTDLIDFENPLHGDYNFYVFEVEVNDRSYLYGCKDVVSVRSDIDIPVWIYALIAIMSFILITIGICAAKHYRMIKNRHRTLIYN